MNCGCKDRTEPARGFDRTCSATLRRTFSPAERRSDREGSVTGRGGRERRTLLVRERCVRSADSGRNPQLVRRFEGPKIGGFRPASWRSRVFALDAPEVDEASAGFSSGPGRHDRSRPAPAGMSEREPAMGAAYWSSRP